MGRYFALAVVVMLAVLARPNALLTFSVLSLAAGLGAVRPPHLPRHGTPWGKREE